MNATEITVIGNVVNSPSRNRTQNGSVTNFRVAATERRFDGATQGWVDGSTFFVDVECWGELGGNVSHSISKGDPVVVVGAIRTHEWESEQGRRSRPQIRAEAVAPNLARGVADFKQDSPVPRRRRRSPVRRPTCRRTSRTSRPTSSTGEDYVAGSSPLYRAGLRELLPGTGARLVVPGWEDRRRERTGWGRDPAAPPPLARRRKASKPSGSVHLLHGPCPQGARRQGDPRQRHPGVPPRRQDRRRRPERRRQVDRPQDHGRQGAGLQRRRDPDPGLLGRHARAGAARSTRSSTCAATSRRRSSRCATR